MARKDILEILLMMHGENGRKNSRKRSCPKRTWGYNTRKEREMEVDTLWLGNDKNNVIPDIVLSYF